MKPEYDVFISFKHRESDGITPTRDSQLAEEIYRHLASRGFKVFFSKVSLEQLGADAFKRAIDDALDASTVLVVVGTSVENLESRWVYYEWDSFLQEILSGRKRNGRVFACIEARSQFLLPYALRSLTLFRHGLDPIEKLSNYVGAQRTEEQKAREAERLAREAAAREAEREREAAAREAAEHEALRLKREAAAREVDRLERELAVHKADQARVRAEAAREDQLGKLLVRTSVAEMTEEQAAVLESGLRELEELRRGSDIAELARTTLDALVRRDESAVSRLIIELVEALAREAAESASLTGAAASGTQTVRAGLASAAHPHADPDRAVKLNIEYQKALARWKSLPFLERIRTKEPPLPPGAMG